MIAPHTYERPRRYTVAVKVIDIFGNDTMMLVPVNVGYGTGRCRSRRKCMES